jgi:hypothetical protein
MFLFFFFGSSWTDLPKAWRRRRTVKLGRAAPGRRRRNNYLWYDNFTLHYRCVRPTDSGPYPAWACIYGLTCISPLNLHPVSRLTMCGFLSPCPYTLSRRGCRSQRKLYLYLLTYLRSWALLEKPPVVQRLNNFPAVYGTRRFITVFTRALHWSLSWDRSI